MARGENRNAPFSGGAGGSFRGRMRELFQPEGEPLINLGDEFRAGIDGATEALEAVASPFDFLDDLFTTATMTRVIGAVLGMIFLSVAVYALANSNK